MQVDRDAELFHPRPERFHLRFVEILRRVLPEVGEAVDQGTDEAQVPDGPLEFVSALLRIVQRDGSERPQPVRVFGDKVSAAWSFILRASSADRPASGAISGPGGDGDKIMMPIPLRSISATRRSMSCAPRTTPAR